MNRFLNGGYVSIEADGNLDKLWDGLDSLEIAAKELVSLTLDPFKHSIRSIYLAGITAPTLPGTKKNNVDLELAALFLKRALSDFRGVWLLITLGYTSQAASVGASLYENSLAVVALAGNPENAMKLLRKSSGNLPWTPKKLSQIAVKLSSENSNSTGQVEDQNNYQRAWRQVYAGYKWLCQIKHPTMPSVKHDADSTSVRPEEYVVMAIPDTRLEDYPVKVTIINIAIARMIEAIRSFIEATGCETRDPKYREISNNLNTAYQEVLDANDQLDISDLPFTISHTELASEYSKLINKAIEDRDDDEN
jgi:hypothetical protein